MVKIKYRQYTQEQRLAYLKAFDGSGQSIRTCQTITIIEQFMDPGYKNAANLIDGDEEFGVILPREAFRLELPRQQSWQTCSV